MTFLANVCCVCCVCGVCGVCGVCVCGVCVVCVACCVLCFVRSPHLPPDRPPADRPTFGSFFSLSRSIFALFVSLVEFWWFL